MRCQRCRKVGPPRAKFCPACGAKLEFEALPLPQSPGAAARWPGDLQPALAAIAETAARLGEARDGLIYLVDGDESRPAAAYGPRILEKGTYTRESLLREVRDLVTARVARRGGAG